ncbi:lysozyme inhibitor LprI family protein [Agarivorans sp. Alg241-V36]|uniref:lysozyme inhibitor LprI family protein n=1 Tax=Agarivorans sp. Alg241-V36 TaxID=2305992 RepID=UPI0013CF729F|nr:lysozyme inhibitor LprI family protein [Agarivorans sp. Alg241-V36]
MNTLIAKVFLLFMPLVFVLGQAQASEESTSANKPKVNIIGKCWQRTTKPEVNKCLENSLAQLDHQVRQRLVVLHKQALDLESISDGAKGAVQALEKAKVEFSEFRQSLCSWESLMMASGSGSGSQYLSCEIELTQHWLSRLRQW